MTLRAGIYLRISEDRKGEGLGVARQREACEQLCAARGWQVVEVFAENDTSASTTKPRPEFTRLLGMIEAREIDAVVAWQADRLVRRLVDLERIIDLCENSGVKLTTVSGELDLSTAAGRGNARILASVARLEVELKSERQRAAFEQALQAGKPAGGGRRAFGYTPDGLHLDPNEAPIAAKMFERFAGGDSLGEIKRDLNSRDIRTPRGHTWTTGSVKQVLMNPRYAGLRGLRRVRFDEHGHKTETASGHTRREHWYEVTGPAMWPGVVPEKMWRACERRLRDPARAKHYTGSTQRYLLSGLAVCGVCGRKLKSGTNPTGRTLKCPQGPGRHVVRRAARIEEFVTAVILERLRRPDAIHLVQVRGEGVDVRGLQTEAEQLRRNLEEYAEDAGAGRLTRQEYFVLRDAAHARLSEIDSQLADAGRTNVVAQVVGSGRDPVETWEACSLSTQRQIIDTLCVVRVMRARSGRPKGDVFDTDSVRIEWK